jgi:hypothetical protein
MHTVRHLGITGFEVFERNKVRFKLLSIVLGGEGDDAIFALNPFIKDTLDLRSSVSRGRWQRQK